MKAEQVCGFSAGRHGTKKWREWRFRDTGSEHVSVQECQGEGKVTWCFDMHKPVSDWKWKNNYLGLYTALHIYVSALSVTIIAVHSTTNILSVVSVNQRVNTCSLT